MNVRRKKYGGRVLVGLVLAALGSWLPAAPVYVAVLEQFENDWHLRQVSPTVRVAFVLPAGKAKGWKAMPMAGADDSQLASLSREYPASVSWTAIFGGQAVGGLLSRRQAARDVSDIGKQEIVSGLESVSPVAAGSFAQWIGKAAFRPLVLTSNGSVTDPDGWQRLSPAAAVTDAQIAAFRKQVPRMPSCVNTDPLAEKLPYTDDKVRARADYQAQDGRQLLGLYIANTDTACADVRDASEFSTYWFVGDGAKITYLGTEIRPLQAVDLDGDGHSAWIFCRSSFGKDGYVLFYGGFKHRVDFSWNYH
jgi:hypothetical protein